MNKINLVVLIITIILLIIAVFFDVNIFTILSLFISTNVLVYLIFKKEKDEK